MTKAKSIALGDVLVFLILSALLGLLIAYPDTVSRSAAAGLTQCVTVIVPALFPFLVLSSVMIKTGAAGLIGGAVSPMLGRLFRVSPEGVSAFVIGILGGYPLGAKTVAELYGEGRITKAEAEHLLAFSSNCGPAFILGACGAGVFQSAKAGAILLAAHIAAAVLVGVLFRPAGPGENSAVCPNRAVMPLPAAFVEAVKGSVRSLMDITGFVMFFQVMSGIVSRLRPLPNGTAGVLIEGFMEMTSGVFRLGELPYKPAMAAASFLIGWGGLCVHCQAVSCALPRGLKVGRYFRGKLLQGLLSAGLTYILCLVISV